MGSAKVDGVNSSNQTILDELLVVVLAVASVLLLFLEATSVLSQEQRRVVGYADLTIACLFLVEFAYRFGISEQKGRFLRRHWWELVASIPLTLDWTQALRAIQLLRVVRIVRLLRVLRLGGRLRVLASASQTLARYRSIVTLTSVVSTIVFTASLAFHYFEAGVNQNVHGLGDSLWWSLTTVTTVGYGDIFPVTSGGRFVSAILMIIGIGTLGAYTGLIASFVIENRHEGS
jgi:voltage-gated potassium channel